LWAGQSQAALQRMSAAVEAMPTSMRARPGGFRMALVRVEAMHATQETGVTRTAAQHLVTQMQQARATETWTYRSAVELLAMATARNGDAHAALGLLRDLDARPAVPAPSAVERAESQLRRAQLFKVVGQSVESQTAAKQALVDLAGQHPNSPRLLLAKQLAADVAAPGR
jgi:hypothetical protein